MKKLAVFTIILGTCSFWGPVYAQTEDTDKLISRTCTQCHSVKRIESKVKTKSGWKKTTSRMLKRLVEENPGTEIEDEKIMQAKAEKISSYLYEQYGYKNSKTVSSRATKRREKFREEFPPTEAKTVSPGTRTVK